jgi:hypothetical protein
MTKAEQEVTIGKCADQDHWTIYSTDPYWTRFFRALGQKVGWARVQHQGGTKFVLPASQLRFAAKRRLHLRDSRKIRWPACWMMWGQGPHTIGPTLGSVGSVFPPSAWPPASGSRRSARAS